MKNESNVQTVIFIILSILILIVKFITLWRSAKENQKLWFISIFVIFLLYSPVSFFVDIAYLFFFSKKKLTFVEIKSWFGK